MPITGPSSYVDTTQEFSAHWEQADTTLGVGNEVVLPGGVTRVNLDTLLAALETKRALVQAKLNLAQTARGAVNAQKGALLLRLDQFNEKVRGALAGTKYERALPNIPGETEGQGPVMEALDDAESLWEQINADPAAGGPIKLLGNYLQAQFATDIVALRAAYKAWKKAEKIADLTREERNDIQDEIYPILLSYRKNLPTFFAKTHALVATLPRLTPEPGATPKAVRINVVYDEATAKAKVTFPASSETNIVHYSVRFSVGTTYSTNDENVIANIPAGPGPFTFFTDAGLAVAGDEIVIKVYTVNDTGNEKGSNAVAVVKPAAPTPP